MKKSIFSVILLVFVMSMGNPISAQKAKFGHTDYAQLVQAMPEIDSAQNVVSELKKSLEATGLQMQEEIQTKYESFQANQASYSPAVAKIKQKEIEDLYKRLQEFSENAHAQLQAKQSELLAPIQEKVLAAIKAVAKRENYTYIFDIKTVAYHTDSTDITNIVKAELGIK